MYEIFLKDDETGLLVSNLGRVVGERGWVLKGRPSTWGHLRIAWRHSDGKQHEVYVHRLVARNFIPNPKNLPFINHRDENPSNNRVDNLEWCTAKYNSNYGTLNKRMRATQIVNGHTRKCSLEKDGKLYHANSIEEMAIIVNASRHSVESVLRGESSKVKGFHLIGVTPKQTGYQPKQIKLTNGDETLTFRSYSEASEYTGAHISNFSKLVRGTYKQLNGWRIAK